MTCESTDLGFLEWSVASKAHPHEFVCGDMFAVKQSADSVVLCAMDGLGHGPEARRACEIAAEALEQTEHTSVLPLLNLLHESLKPSRGAVLSLAEFRINSGTLTWAGIGNVEGLLFSSGSHTWLPLRNGIVGCRIPTLTSHDFELSPGDMLIMFSDGIQSADIDKVRLVSTEEVAQDIIHSRVKGHDDALVLVAQYRGFSIGRKS